ncbi:uncharacterized protein FOMMEDRAFT_21188 [Fomitiporia mediterranea MF3/22]|uniref:uncharacterized protein n=1 Tax=Fomitiporia mediterranea (strain MF3/22) TaxID=694068 RepID=UPI0004409507|nr:uncharacterized protein FOMMEDRAFT_21188 [Fomitiporia mediterranea MF3/22]EJD02472.1 hypothetical protein FOMMEDRAFT_21188 [Fomitiporia mediterranea MF3/22]
MSSCRQRRGLLPALASALVLGALRGIQAQITSNATCLSNWADLYNSKGQSPCLVGAYLGGVCNGGQYDVGALEDGQHYIGPTPLIANPCLCSTVMFSVMGACSTCQNATIITWSSWSSSCDTVYVATFPMDIPSDTAVPGWAYENVTVTGTFDVNQALQDNSPESTATFVQQTNSGTRTSGTATGTATSPIGDNDGNSGEKKKTNTGAIAGGVVGGVVGLALIALLIFFLMRRNKNKNKGYANGGANVNLTGSTYGGYNNGLDMVHKDEYQPVPYTPNAYDGNVPVSGGAMGSPPMAQQQKLYDPNDPSTFPTSPAPPGSIPNQTTGQSFTPSFPQPSTHSGVPTHDSSQGAYRGVAEI